MLAALRLKIGFFPSSTKLCKFLLVITGVISVGLGFSWWFKFWPFKPAPQTQFWGCQKDTNQWNTGFCIQYNDKTKGPWDSEEKCLNSKTCTQYWGCEKDSSNPPKFTGQCKQYGNPLDGPYYSQNQCLEDVRNKESCVYLYGCKKGDNGFNVQPPDCIQYDVKDLSKPKDLYDTLEKCKDSCKNFWYCQSRKNKTCKQVLSADEALETSSTEQDCLKTCK